MKPLTWCIGFNPKMGEFIGEDKGYGWKPAKKRRKRRHKGSKTAKFDRRATFRAQIGVDRPPNPPKRPKSRLLQFVYKIVTSKTKKF